MSEHSPNPSIGVPFEPDALEMPVDKAVSGMLPEDCLPGLPMDDVPAVEVKKVRYRAKPKFSFPIPLKVVLIDLDGTLLDTVGDIIAAANAMRGTLRAKPVASVAEVSSVVNAVSPASSSLRLLNTIPARSVKWLRATPAV